MYIVSNGEQKSVNGGGDLETPIVETNSTEAIKEDKDCCTTSNADLEEVQEEDKIADDQSSDDDFTDDQMQSLADEESNISSFSEFMNTVMSGEEVGEMPEEMKEELEKRVKAREKQDMDALKGAGESMQKAYEEFAEKLLCVDIQDIDAATYINISGNQYIDISERAMVCLSVIDIIFSEYFDNKRLSEAVNLFMEDLGSFYCTNGIIKLDRYQTEIYRKFSNFKDDIIPDRIIRLMSNFAVLLPQYSDMTFSRIDNAFEVFKNVDCSRIIEEAELAGQIKMGLNERVVYKLKAVSELASTSEEEKERLRRIISDITKINRKIES